MPLLLVLFLLAPAPPQDDVYPAMPPGAPPLVPVEGSVATTEAEMQPYRESVPSASTSFSLVPIPGGTFTMGSPAGERDRNEDEAPHEVTLAPFWMGTHEVTWDEYHPFMLKLDLEVHKRDEAARVTQDDWADAVSRPTPPYVPMDFEMGVEGYPAACMTQFAAKQYTKWLSMKTGRFYRLPTEAEWEYACRAGTSTAYSFGDDDDDLEEYAWYFDNADDAYQLVGKKKPNPWGLYDMHGNVAEWVLDAYAKSYPAAATAPLAWPTELYPRVIRGGSWYDDPEHLRSAARKRSKQSWKVQDPQLPKSIWYHTEATHVGFRVVRPLVEPSEEEKARYWEADVESVRKVQERQRQGGR